MYDIYANHQFGTTYVGKAFEHKDGIMNVYLDCLPYDKKLILKTEYLLPLFPNNSEYNNNRLKTEIRH